MFRTKMLKKEKGLTLIELLIVIGILAILMTGIIVAVNPGRQFSQARDAQRWTNVEAILSAINQNMVENRGTFTCGAGSIPAATTTMSSSVGDYDICSCLVPNFLSVMPRDPSTGSYTSCTTYDTQYEITRNVTTGRITILAPSAELETISVSR